MKITPIEHGLDLSASDLVRSEGLHMSEIYNDLYAVQEPKRYGGPKPAGFELMGAMGTAWENHQEYLLRRAGVEAIRPQEFRTKEGIAFSPDLLINNGVLRLGEIKLKWMTSKDFPTRAGGTFPPKFQKVLTQMMNYCWNLETPYARVYTNFVIGDGRKPHSPELRAWDIEFSAKEMRDEYQMVLNWARQRRML